MQLFFKSTIAIPQLEGGTSTITIPQLFKEMLLRNRNSAIPQSQFFLKSSTSNLQLESFTSAIFGIFLLLNPVDSFKKIRGKKARAAVRLMQVLFSR
jgi:hypothetical protein